MVSSTSGPATVNVVGLAPMAIRVFLVRGGGWEDEMMWSPSAKRTWVIVERGVFLSREGGFVDSRTSRSTTHAQEHWVRMSLP